MTMATCPLEEGLSDGHTIAELRQKRGARIHSGRLEKRQRSGRRYLMKSISL
jgi:hypothetical protein